MSLYNRLIRPAFHSFLCFLIFFQQTYPSYAQIIVDGAAPSANQAGLTTAPNSVDVVNIAAPSASGLSHNKFTDYNVPSTGVILNNSAIMGTSSLGGVIMGNANITAGSEASTILNEVTSTNASLLEGATEVFGTSADVIIANPNGITCSGCGFINTPTATLTTGTPTIAGGVLTNLSINDGTIIIDAAGLNHAGAHAQILSRAIEINADIQADQIDLMTGRNDYNPQTQALTPKADNGSSAPDFALDSTALGGMYAGQITLRGTEAGVGFRLAGDVTTSANDLIITNDGRIALTNASAANDLTITTTDTAAGSSSDIDLDGTLSSTGSTTLTSANDITLSSDSVLESLGLTTTLQASDVITNDGGALVAIQNLNIKATQLINDSGLITSGGDLSIEGATPATHINILDNLGGAIESVNGDISILANTINNTGSAQFETVTNSFWFEVRGSRVPGWIPVIGITSAGHAQLYDGDTNSYVFAANPDSIQSIVEDSGQSLDDFYDAANDRYLFTVDDWSALAPSNATELSNTIDDWGLFAPEDVRGSYLISQSVTDRVIDGTLVQSYINAHSGDISINVETKLASDISTISAAQDLTITGNGSIDDESYTLQKSTSQQTNGFGGNPFVRNVGWGSWFEFTTARTLTDTVIDTVNSAYAAGNANTISLAGDVVSVSAPAAALSELSFGGVSSGAIRTTLETSNTASTIFVNSAATQPSSNANFVLETRFDFTNLDTFFGSDYFLTGVLGAGYDPSAITRRLGDAYIDTAVISAQVLAKTGRKFLDSSTSTDTDQVRALLDNGIAAQSALSLTPFIALTPEQQNTLTQDIVWYEERDIDGQPTLVPQLYLTQATFDELGTSLRSTTFSGQSVDIAADNIILDGARVSALDDVALDTAQDFALLGGAIDADNAIINAGNDLTIATTATQTGNGASEIGSLADLQSTVNARTDLTLTSGNDTSLIGAAITAGQNIVVSAQNAIIDTLQQVSAFNRTGGQYQVTKTQTSHLESSLEAGDSLGITVRDSIFAFASALFASNEIELNAAAGDIVIETAQSINNATAVKGDKSQATSQEITHQRAALSTQTGDISITADLGDITLRAADINSGNDITLTATDGAVELLTAKDRDFHQHTITKSNAAWQKSTDLGAEHETIQHTLLTGEGTLNITAANGVTVEYKSTGNLDSDIDQLSQAPGLAWMADLKDDPNVDWQAITEIHREWHDEQEGLGGPAMAVLMIALVIVTSGQGAALLTSAGTTATTTAAGATVTTGLGTITTTTAATATAAATTATTFTTAGAMANGAFSALISQAAVATINAKGNPAEAFKTLASSDTVRAVAVSALTAGLLDGAGLESGILKDGKVELDLVTDIGNQLKTVAIQTTVDATISGKNLNDALINNLRFAGAALLTSQVSQEIGEAFNKGKIDRGLQLIAHAATGCAAGAIGTGNCGGGAAGQVAGEIVALGYTKISADDLKTEIDTLRDSGVTDPLVLEQKLFEWKARGANIAKIAGAFGSAVAGGSAADVNLGSELGGAAAENNALFLLAIPVALAVLNAADKGILVYDAYRIQDAYANGDKELGDQLAKEFAIGAAIELTVGSAIPGSKILASIGSAVAKKGDGVLAKSFTAAANNLDGVGSTGVKTSLNINPTKIAIDKAGFKFDDLIANANKPINDTGLTEVGRALDKHASGQRADGTFPKLSGNIANRNKVANETLNEIITNPKSTVTKLGQGGIEIRLPDRRGVRYNSDGSLSGFLDP